MAAYVSSFFIPAAEIFFDVSQTTLNITPSLFIEITFCLESEISTGGSHVSSQMAC